MTGNGVAVPHVPPDSGDQSWQRAVALTQLLEAGIAFQGHGQLSCTLVVNLVIAQIQPLEKAVGS